MTASLARVVAASADTALKRTPLYDRHVAAGAKLVPFAGWEMPVQYTGVKAEHLATRATAGVFDVSHMGEIATSGPDAERFLQRLLCNDVTKLQIGGAQYSVLCREDGGVLDDLFTYRLAADRFLTVTNAANHETDLAWFRRHAAGFDVTVEDAATALRDARRPGPAGARDRPGAGRRAAARPLHLPPPPAARQAGAGLRHGLHRRGRRRAALRPRRRGRCCGTRSSAAAPCPPGWPRATPCAWRSATTSTATT